MMKKILLFLLVFPVCIFAQQQEVFRIDSLPQKGVMLNQGWKWHAGDNLEWAKPEFDDSNWKLLPPLDLMDSLPQKLRPSDIRWLRLKLQFDKSLINAILALAIDQIGASEIYMNGKLLQRYGVVSSNPDEVKAFNPLLDPIPFIVSKDSMVILAVRYTYQNNVNKYLPSPPNLLGLTININTLEIIQSSKVLTLTRLYDSNVFRVGAFFILFISYFALYFYNPHQKANLFLCLFSLTILIADLVQLKCYNYHWTAEYTIFSVLFFFLVGVSKILLLAAVFFLMDQKINRLFVSLSGLIFLSFFLFIIFGYHSVINLIAVHIFPNLINLEIIRITLKAIQSQKKGAWIIALGGITFLISVVLFVFMVYFNFIDMPLWGSVQTVGDLVYNVSWLSIPLAVAIYFGQEVAFNNSSLKEKLIEVEQLSVEKQLILSTQNETLEHQVAERTAELSSKNRELEIEAALERVRSRTIAMQRSSELADCTQLLFQQIQVLELPFLTCGFLFIDESLNLQRGWTVSPDGTLIPNFIDFPLTGDEVLDQRYESWKQNKPLHIADLKGEANKAHHQFLASKVPSSFSDDIIAHLPDRIIFYSANFSQGCILILATEFLKKEEEQILIRFAKVFEQIYTRFLDLQKAEAQVKEANKQASLERVRGQIASMRSAEDLQLITPLIWQELTNLEIPFIRCGLFIIDEANAHLQALLAAPDGHSLGSLSLSIEAHDLTLRILMHWRQKTIFRQHWNKEEFLEWTQSLFEQGQITDREIFQGAATAPESLDLHFVPFTQGMLYVGSTTPLSPVEAELVHSLADEFAIAYARYEDFRQLEKAKQSIESTLNELRATQAQLIQSEKLASLGELTAGIAHEIQNPLNFVNNFSELSVELAEELKGEINKPELDKGLIAELAADLATNQEKINHHGKRASAIVKGMLEHSRTGDAMNRVSTDLNALADEYLRLAYHGLRAKDSSFNATMETHFDPDLPEIEVIPQDIGRVLLNLINNAFYAVHQRAVETRFIASTPQIEYQPTVTITTRKLENAIEISVKDNGIGIPEAIKDKIFQPFFTTKPTGQGTGLGLSLAYDIVTKGHGGSLEVKTKEKEGTVFTIMLPLKTL